MLHNPHIVSIRPGETLYRENGHLPVYVSPRPGVYVIMQIDQSHLLHLQDVRACCQLIIFNLE